MAIGFVALLIIVTLMVAGFLIYGMFLGIARFGRLIAQGYRWLLAQDEIHEDWRIPPDGTRNVIHLQETPIPKCWEIKGCPLETRATCPAYINQSVPCWIAWMIADKEQRLKPDCLACSLFSIPSLIGRV